MSFDIKNHLIFKSLRKMIPFAYLVLLVLPTTLRAQEPEDFDQYKLRVDAFWFYSANPSGTLQGSSDAVPIDFQKDLGFNSFSTITGKVDWKFTRKNHFYVAVSPFYHTRQRTLERTIVFQGQTFDVGLVTKAQLNTIGIAPGYQYDIIRRKRGHLGLGIQVDLFDSTAKLSAAAQVVNGEPHPGVSARGSLLAPVPVAGPDFRFYLTNSTRVFVAGNVYGMYLFGYGNFVSTTDAIGVTLHKHISLNAGYQLGSRLVVNNDSSAKRIGIHLTQQGAVAGREFSF